MFQVHLFLQKLEFDMYNFKSTNICHNDSQKVSNNNVVSITFYNKRSTFTFALSFSPQEDSVSNIFQASLLHVTKQVESMGALETESF